MICFQMKKLIALSNSDAFLLLDALNLAKLHYSQFLSNGLFTDDSILNRLDDLDHIQTKLINAFNPERKPQFD